MSQNINFLKGIPKKSTQLTSSVMAVVLLGTFGALVIGSLMLSYKQLSAHLTLNAAKSTLVLEQQAYNQLAQTYPLLVSDIPLLDQVKALEDKYQNKKNEAQSLADVTVRPGFYQYMLGLAQSAPSTLWLNQIQINHTTDSITLNGYSIAPNEVSELMSHLTTATAYSDIIFNLFFVKTMPNNGYIKFSIATNDLGPEEEINMEQKDQATQTKE